MTNGTGAVVLVPGRRYVAGRGGLRVVDADGRETHHPAGAVVHVQAAGLRAYGRARTLRIRTARGTYETQDLRAEGR